MYFPAVFGISFPGIPRAVITFSPSFCASALSIPPGFDATSIIKTFLLNSFNCVSVNTICGTVFIIISILPAKLGSSEYISGSQHQHAW